MVALATQTTHGEKQNGSRYLARCYWQGLLNINIPQSQYDRMEKLKDETDRPLAAMVRRALDAYLDAEEAALRKRK